MVVYVLSEQPNCWHVHRYGEGVTAVATVKTEEQARHVAFERARQEVPSYILRIGLKGQSELLSAFGEQSSLPD